MIYLHELFLAMRIANKLQPTYQHYLSHRTCRLIIGLVQVTMMSTCRLFLA